MNLGAAADRVGQGKTVVMRVMGNSMVPHVRSGSIVEIEPLPAQQPVVGKIVLAKVHARWYLHFAKAERNGQVQIANAQGRVNGWTSRRNVVGILKR